MKKSNQIKILFMIITCFVIFVLILSYLVFPNANYLSSDEKIKIKEITKINPVNTTLKIHATTLLDDGCAKCHTQPIIAECFTCHPSPPTIINDEVLFPHHDPAPGGPNDDCSSDVCHDAGEDIRYVTVLVAGHDYCPLCHTENQCWRCHAK